MDRPLIALATAILACASAQGCERRELPPRGQLLLHIDTDAPLVQPPEVQRAAFEPPGLFDAVRVEVLTTDGSLACVECRRDFPVDRRKLTDEATSVGLLAPPGRGGLLLRVRLFRAERVRGNGEPAPESTIDEAFVVPPIGEEGVVERTARLSLERVGAGRSEQPQPLLDGRAFAHRTYPDSAPSECKGTARDGDVCVPGGSFWMSDADQNLRYPGQNAPERVVVLSPFWIDRGEVTVAELRASGLATKDDPDPKTAPAVCTYSATPGATDDLPVTCVTHELASRYCEAQGKTLPSEAQFEFVASGMRGARFPWGDDVPSCDDAVYARTVDDKIPQLRACITLGEGTRPRGSGARDVLRLAGGSVFDLAGNAHEMTRDSYQPLEGDCWSRRFLVDPVCERGHTVFVMRGGGVESWSHTLRSTVRETVVTDTRYHNVGFRCVRAAR